MAKSGLGSLKTAERELLPSPLNRGSEFYFERFSEAVGGSHFPVEKLENYFWAQSIWDDVMSWQALEFIKRNPNDTLVILVGDFHAAYGGGLPDILKRKGFHKVKVISQTIKSGLSDRQLIQEISPHPKYGPRADWVWVTP